MIADVRAVLPDLEEILTGAAREPMSTAGKSGARFERLRIGGSSYVHRRDLTAALSAIKTRAIVMPSTTDFLFQVRDSAAEVVHMPDAELRPIPSAWGHVAGFGANPADNEFVDAAITELLGPSPQENTD